jgi:hypothetical protein
LEQVSKTGQASARGSILEMQFSVIRKAYMQTTKILFGILTITTTLLAQAQAQAPAFVTVSAPTNAAYSTNGITWSASTLSTSATWVGVAYGNGLFVASAENSSNAAYSTDGINWSASTLCLRRRPGSS